MVKLANLLCSSSPLRVSPVTLDIATDTALREPPLGTAPASNLWYSLNFLEHDGTWWNMHVAEFMLDFESKIFAVTFGSPRTVILFFHTCDWGHPSSCFWFACHKTVAGCRSGSDLQGSPTCWTNNLPLLICAKRSSPSASFQLSFIKNNLLF